MVEVEGSLDKAWGVKNLEQAIAWIDPPPSKTHLERIISSLNSLEKYLTFRGKLPPGFSPFRIDNGNSRLGEHLASSTHTSSSDWGWMGRHDYIVFVRLEEGLQNSIIAVLRTETPTQEKIYTGEKKVIVPRSRSHRVRRKLGEDQVPKFRI